MTLSKPWSRICPSSRPDELAAAFGFPNLPEHVGSTDEALLLAIRDNDGLPDD